jgi:hypothetical protein
MQHRSHRFIDEAGDPIFFGRGGVNRLGSEGVSKAFMLGMVRIKQPLPEVRARITSFIQQVAADPFFNRIPSIRERLERGSMFLHASYDPSELRNRFFELLRDEIDFSLQAVVGRKQATRFINKHHSKQTEFYADLLSHLLKDKANHHQLVLNIADQGNTTRMRNLRDALSKAHLLYRESQPNGAYKASIVFNVQPYDREPLLAVVDYSLWAVQRIFERGETRFYDMIVDKVSLVVDLYDTANAENKANYYTPKHPLTRDNMLKLNP